MGSGWTAEPATGENRFAGLDLMGLGPDKGAFQASLAAMRDHADLLLTRVEGAPREELRQQLTAIRQGTVGLQHEVENVLLVALLHRQAALPLQRRPTTPETWLRTTLPTLRLLVETDGQMLRVARRGALPAILVDGQRLALAVANLVVQAAALTRPPGPVELTLAGRKGALRIGVSDRGPALCDPVPNSGFSGIVRAETTDLPDPAAGAVRLAVAQAIVEAHGGRTAAANRTGGGAVYWLELPAHEQPGISAG